MRTGHPAILLRGHAPTMGIHGGREGVGKVDNAFRAPQPAILRTVVSPGN
ncbi:hypothetical protein [Singulisphaera acidiphila]|nr:hypothetical protein [Singulisphaera acidiphila]